MIQTEASARDRVIAKLRGWYKLTRDIERLTREIQEDTEYVQQIQLRIESSIIPSYEGMDMPRGSGISDKTGNLAAKIVDKQLELQNEIMLKELELRGLVREMQRIDDALDSLNPCDKDIIKRFYLLGERYEGISNSYGFSKSRFYQLRDSVLDKLTIIL